MGAPFANKYNKSLHKLREFKVQSPIVIEKVSDVLTETFTNNGKKVLDILAVHYDTNKHWFSVHKNNGDFALILLSNLPNYPIVLYTLSTRDVCDDMERKPWVFVLCCKYNKNLMEILCEDIEGSNPFCNYKTWKSEVERFFVMWNLKVPRRVRDMFIRLETVSSFTERNESI